MDSTKINQLQLAQQNLQNILLQKQQIQSQIAELNSALIGLEKTEKSYKIVGNIMLASPKEDLSKELQDRKEVIEIRLKNLVKQEEHFKKSIEEIQKEVVDNLNEKKNEQIKK